MAMVVVGDMCVCTYIMGIHNTVSELWLRNCLRLFVVVTKTSGCHGDGSCGKHVYKEGIIHTTVSN